MKVNDFEIMAPVGSRESLAAAIQAGADSVYFGVEQLNMRSHSANHFTLDDLRDIARQCNSHGIKTYLTVNTIIYDEDIALMHEIVDAAREAGISAIIASDVAVMQYVAPLSGPPPAPPRGRAWSSPLGGMRGGLPSHNSHNYNK